MTILTNRFGTTMSLTICLPCCEYPRLKHWKELSDEEKFLAERLPLSAEFTKREREKHLFCPRCWNESAEKTAEIC